MKYLLVTLKVISRNILHVVFSYIKKTDLISKYDFLKLLFFAGIQARFIILW